MMILDSTLAAQLAWAASPDQRARELADRVALARCRRPADPAPSEAALRAALDALDVPDRRPR